jgi:hypothetical protein
MPKRAYYALGDIEEEDVRRYSIDEMSRFLEAYEHYGPWEGPDRVPMTPEQKERWLEQHDRLPSDM